MFEELTNGMINMCGFSTDLTKDDTKTNLPYTFGDAHDKYKYPGLYEEADEMLQVSLLIYSITDLRTLAKKAKAGKLKSGSELSNPDLILNLPLRLDVGLGMIEENVDLIRAEVGDADHEMTMSALQSIRQRYSRDDVSLSTEENSSKKKDSSQRWRNPFATSKTNVSASPASNSPYLVAYGDDKPDKELVYAVGVDPVRKRVTVAFRGSVTPTDFLTDATIAFKREPNPIQDLSKDQSETIGIHQGFYNYLLKERKENDGKSKLDEIFEHVEEAFADSECRASYKLYVTGHSLGGALSTLFGFYAASSAIKVPTPITVVSIASPRVGDTAFQSAFACLERQGVLRHLRVANEGDPVTILPEGSGKKVWAMMSPISYAAYKISDSKFKDKETYRHTGVKLLLLKRKGSKGEYTETQDKYKLSYSVKSMKANGGKIRGEENEENNSKGSQIGNILPSFKMEDIPEVWFHFGDTYCENMTSVKEDLAPLSLNEVYRSVTRGH
uniref:Fungal lipase-type domain-containing protein n=1 Tax=Helicotheca tamesis TaxID=374047 RepID=A0A7S2IH72_9STRA|eukprot:CAMPEP_0185729528 /NCGR_PEP_ID=MMETSP1171-20130828/6303_1 /TAXON_ID=374046 /ORGANISM="Helicotheca tamensis, Strain CCMP826" /LENGTH=499 /DNA_ID=CAMNT_0028398395 /DNA_START=52 /DNA_END=1551 /DNA_ORIENTATION=+